MERFLQDIAAGKTATERKRLAARSFSQVKGGKGTATRTVGLLGGIFAFAVRHKLRPDNPVRGVARFKDGRSERFLSAAELARLTTDNLMTTKEAAAYLQLSPSLLNKLRLTGGGPVFVRLAGRAIRYRRADLDAWIAASVMASTSQALRHAGVDQ